MPRWEPEHSVTQSVLERLIDNDPKESTEMAPTRAQSVRQLKAALRRDLDWLLNSRRTPERETADYPELENSVFCYGLPDLSSFSWQSERDRQRLARSIEIAIETFEPRLRRVRVIPVGELSGTQFVLRFQIEGMLQMSPSPEHISFDTVLQLSSGEYQVKGEPSAG
jgi:type VI secretion system protein ImpF